VADVPTVADVVAYSGRSSETGVGPHLDAAIALVKSYTRSIGFEDFPDSVPDDVAAVIVSVAARTVGNPELLRSVTVGDGMTVTETHAVVGGLSWLEQITLARYRQRTA
jgi:hypothetical protein